MNERGVCSTAPGLLNMAKLLLLNPPFKNMYSCYIKLLTKQASLLVDSPNCDVHVCPFPSFVPAKCPINCLKLTQCIKKYNISQIKNDLAGLSLRRPAN